jgi:hypothetical protein
MFKREEKNEKKNRYTIQKVAKNDALTCDNVERKKNRRSIISNSNSTHKRRERRKAGEATKNENTTMREPITK